MSRDETRDGWHRHPNGGGLVEDTATVADTAHVGPDASVSGYASVGSQARITDGAEVGGLARLTGSVWVAGNTTITGQARVDHRAVISAGRGGRVRITGHSHIAGDARISGDVEIAGHPTITGGARLEGAGIYVGGGAMITGDSHLSGDAQVRGDALIFGDARLDTPRHVLTIGPVGSEDRTLTLMRAATGHQIAVGCWAEPDTTIDDLEDEIIGRSVSDNWLDLKIILALCRERISEWKMER